MERPWMFVSGTPLDAFAREIAAEMVRLFGITEDEAEGRINRAWGDVSEFDPIVLHRPPEHWAYDMFFGHESYWWIRDENVREKLGLTPVVPLAYP